MSDSRMSLLQSAPRLWYSDRDKDGRKTWTTKGQSDEGRTYVLHTLFISGPASSLHTSTSPTLHSPASPENNGHHPKHTPISCLVNRRHLQHLPTSDQLLSAVKELPMIPVPSFTIEKTPYKGFGLFASRDIEVGELICWEHPAAILPSTDRGFSDDIYEDIEAGLLLPSPRTDADAGAVHSRHEEAKAMANVYEGICGSWVEGVVRTNGIVLEWLNGKRAKGKKMEKEKGNRKESEDEDKEIYGGIYPLINRSNHSCAPNAMFKWSLTTFTACLYALRDIKAGEEIFKSYVNSLLPRATRMETLKTNHKFTCDCPHCSVRDRLSSLHSSTASSLSVERPVDTISADTDIDIGLAEEAHIRNSDANRTLLSTWIFTQPSYKKWTTDLCRPDDLIINSHLSALRLIEQEEVYALQSIFMEEVAMAYAMLGDLDEFRKWGELLKKVCRVEDKELSAKFEEWLVDPERRVKKWGWRRKQREEMSKRKEATSLEIEPELLEGIFGPIDD